MAGRDHPRPRRVGDGVAVATVTTYRLGTATVQQTERYTITRYDDGGQVVADHAPQLGQADTAEAHGLTVEDMNRDHDLAHTLLAVMLGLPASPTLAGVASGKHWPHWHREEAAVLALQGYAAAAGADLDELEQQADAIFTRAVRRAEAETLNEAQLTTFSFALDYQEQTLDNQPPGTAANRIAALDTRVWFLHAVASF